MEKNVLGKRLKITKACVLGNMDKFIYDIVVKNLERSSG